MALSELKIKLSTDFDEFERDIQRAGEMAKQVHDQHPVCQRLDRVIELLEKLCQQDHVRS